ncbi:hypothetical protein C8J57DRAFT_1722931 [Mycena rebaudengoi]|nr:hypothetical protein C8J57DRAFT_1722931 [Mycena rebaudengoi]
MATKSARNASILLCALSSTVELEHSPVATPSRFFDFKSHRTRLLAWTAKKEEKNIASTGDSEGRVSGLVDGLKRYWNTKNTKSLDSLTGLPVAPYTCDTFPVKDINYKADNEATKSRYRFLTINSAGGMNLVVGFSLGVLATSVYMRMSR